MRSAIIAAISASGSVPVGQARSLSATSVTSDSATLNGSVDSPNGATTTVDFLYSTASDLSGATTVSATPSTVTTIGATVSAALSGLTPGLTYYYAVKITNTGGTAQGTTLSTLMYTSATISSSTSVGATAATFNGTVTSAGSSSTVVFEYATDTGFTSPVQVTAAQSPVVNSSSVAVSAAVTGLSSGRTYYVRLKATNATGTTTSASYSSFSTLATATTNTVTTFGLTTATLLGTVTSVDNSATVTFEYGTASDLAGASTVTAAQSPLTGTSQSVSAAVTSLTTGTTYYYRVKVVSAGGTVYGSILSFVPYIAPTFGTQTGTSTATTPGTSTTSISNVYTTTATLGYSLGSGAAFYDYSRISGTAVTPSGNSLTGLAQTTSHEWRVRTTNTSSTFALTTRVTPNGSTTTVSVEYGNSNSYGSSAGSVNIGAGTSEVASSWNLGASTSATVYWRATATYSGGASVQTTGTISRTVTVYDGTSTGAFTTYGTYTYVDDAASMTITKPSYGANIVFDFWITGGGGGSGSTSSALGYGGGGGGGIVTASGIAHTSGNITLSRGAGAAMGGAGGSSSLTYSGGTYTAAGGNPGTGNFQGGSSGNGNAGFAGGGITGGGGGGYAAASTNINGGSGNSFSSSAGGGPGFYYDGFASFGWGVYVNCSEGGLGTGGKGAGSSGVRGYVYITYVGPARN